MRYGHIRNYGKGEWLEGSGSTIDILSPLDGSVIATTSNSTYADVDTIIQRAKEAQKQWARKTYKQRAEVLYNYRNLLMNHREEIATINHVENGKTMIEALAGVDKAIELMEFACSIPQIVNQKVERVSQGIICKTHHAPLGVVASITPFNFPIMIPHWTAPNAIAMGNAIIMKPSHQTPISIAFCANLWREAGLPDGIFNIVNGNHEVGEILCDHPDITALTFVGSTPVAKKVYTHATKNLKRVLALGGAKNVLIIVPDASVEATVRDVSTSVTGMAGQRCMAASVAVLVGDASSIFKNRLEEAFKKLNEGNTLPPLISESASTHIEAYLDEAVAKGAKLLVDGRSVRREKGYYIGASILDWTGLEHLMPQEEVFGPVLELLSAETLEDALILQHTSPYGNACSVFTQSGRIAERVENEAHAGMIGVNVGIPVPREPFSFAGIGDSKFGFGEITGELSLEFWSNLIKVTQKWHESEPTNWMD